MEGAASKRNLPHWAAGLPAVIWVQQDALGLSCKNSNWWWMQTQCENNFVHWTNAKQPIVFTNPWPIFSAVLSLLLCSLPSEAPGKMFYVRQCGTYDMSRDKVESSLRLGYVSVPQSDTGANKWNQWGFLSGLVVMSSDRSMVWSWCLMISHTVIVLVLSFWKGTILVTR